MTTPANVDEIYNEIVKPLPFSQQLKLAAMILNDIPSHAVVDYSEAWSEEDVREFSAASWDYALKQVEAEDASAEPG